MSTEVVYLQCWHGWCHMKLKVRAVFAKKLKVSETGIVHH